MTRLPFGADSDAGSEAESLHDAAVARALRLLGPDPANWVPPLAGTDHDVVVVGAGQSGIAIAFWLRRAGIARTAVIDAAEEGGEGIWLTSARMRALRSPKNLPGPELGIPELSFQAWYEARHGGAAFAQMKAIPRLQWAAYLRWYRNAAAVPVRFLTRLERVEAKQQGFRLHLSVAGRPATETCRKIVLATGFLGCGGPNLPDFVTQGLPEGHYAHVEEPIDFARLRGRTVAIFGAASSAFDAAAVALENGAAAVHLFCRHDNLECHSRMRMLFHPGSVEHFHALPDALKWRVMSDLCRRAQGPVPETVRRATRFESFHLHLGARNPSLRMEDGRITLDLGDRNTGLSFDFVIVGAGYRVDLSARPELQSFVDRVALWGDRYQPPAGEENAELARYPYLSSGFALTEKEPGTAPWLKDIHFFNAGALLSNGRNPGEVSGLRHGVPQLVSAIGCDLFKADAGLHVERFLGPCDPILSGREYQHRLWCGQEVLECRTKSAAAG